MSRALAFDNDRVLITGASGFIGSHLSRFLIENGAKVFGTYRTTAPIFSEIDALQIDLRDRDAVATLVAETKPDVIFHLASYVEGFREPTAILPTLQNNLETTINVLLASVAYGKCDRLVLAGSMEEPADNKEAVPSSPYAAAKFAASAYARMFHALYELPVVIARIFMVYGPQQAAVHRLVPHTILSALEGQAPTLSSGQRNIDWIYIDDLIRALAGMAKQTGIEGLTLDLGSGTHHSVQAMVEEILRQIDPQLEPAFGAIADRAMEQQPIADLAATQAVIDWKPEITLPDGITRTIRWYRDQANG